MMGKILIVEDEQDIQDLIAFTLRFHGHEVITAGDGEEACQIAPQVMPDLIMMDVRMPKMTGYEACKRIKANKQLEQIPVVFLSAKGRDTEIQAGLDAGAVEYILKPFAPEKLATYIDDLLQQYD